MNVIAILLDRLRRDHLGCYGNPRIKTANLDAWPGLRLAHVERLRPPACREQG